MYSGRRMAPADFHASTPSQVCKLIGEVLEIEAPMHVDFLVKSVLEHFSFHELLETLKRC